MITIVPPKRPETKASSFLTIEQSRLLLPDRKSAKAQAAWAKTLRAVGSGDGLGRGPGDPRLRITICAWPDEEAARRHFESDLSSKLGRDWAALLSVVSTRGSHRGEAPLVGVDDPLDGDFAALTLGVTSWRQLPRFIRHGTRLSGPLHSSHGLRFAASAGWPLTGNCTFSVWDSEAAMLDFAYRSVGGHVDSARAERPILREQLNARMRMIDNRGITGQ